MNPQPLAKPIAVSILDDAAEALADRAAARDAPTGERSMARCVDIFNAATGHRLTEAEGWQFMIALKWARSNNGGEIRSDDYIDLAGYSALWGECELKR
jgi:hypothetical protein